MLQRLLVPVLLMPLLWFSPLWAEEVPPVEADFEPPAASSAMLPVDGDYLDLQGGKIMRWNDQTRYIMVYIAEAPGQYGWSPENPAVVKEALREWEQALSPRFRFIFMPDERGSDVKVTWTARIDKNGEVAGVNETTTWGKFISRNDIQLAVLSADGQIHTASYLYSVALHEIGHMLGIKGHSDRPEDVMFSSVSQQAWMETRHLSARDVNTMRRIYERKPDYTNPEGYHLSNFERFKKTQKGRRLSLLWIPVPGVPFPIPVPVPF